MAANIAYLEGRTLCVVFCKLVDEDKHGMCTNMEEPKFQIKTMHGRASIHQGKFIDCIDAAGNTFRVPPSAYDRVFPSDGTDILKDAEFFVMVKVSGMDL